MAGLAQEIVDAWEKVSSGNASDIFVRPYQASENPALHQFVFFLKPETTSSKQFPRILALALKSLQEGGIEVGAVRVLSGDFLNKSGIMSQHYGVISKISRLGEEAISDEARGKLHDAFGDKIKAGWKVLGGHQVMEADRNFTPFALKLLNDNIGATRLAGGTYATPVKSLDQNYIILNGFHAYQLVPYTSEGRSIVVFEGRSKTPWKVLRTNVCGATKPEAAVKGSFRNTALVHKEELGIPVVDTSNNCCHMSAGPLEGLVELRRFFSSEQGIALKDTSFGQLLLSKGLKEEQVQGLTENPDFDVQGKKVSAFDLTEESDAVAAADLLHQRSAL